MSICILFGLSSPLCLDLEEQQEIKMEKKTKSNLFILSIIMTTNVAVTLTICAKPCSQQLLEVINVSVKEFVLIFEDQSTAAFY